MSDQFYSYIDATGAGATIISGMSTAGAASFGIGISSDIVCRNLQVTGISTITGADDVATRHLDVTGITTLAGNVNVTGISTFVGNVYLGAGATIGFLGNNAQGTKTVQSGGSPSGGNNGDIFYIY